MIHDTRTRNAIVLVVGIVVDMILHGMVHDIATGGDGGG